MTITLTRAQLEASRAKLASLGIQLVGDSGNVTEGVITLSFSYAEPTLDVEIVHKPWTVPASLIQGKISNWFAQS